MGICFSPLIRWVRKRRPGLHFALGWSRWWEIYQHKGDSECLPEISGILGGEDELCGFEKVRAEPINDCGDEPGAGGMAMLGCVHRLDTIRGALLEGMKEELRIGVNPFALGLIASTDTHSGTPGLVDESSYKGHLGIDEASPEGRLKEPALNPGGVTNSPGGLAAIWAEENSRDGLFDAIRRREVYGTSGPRIAVRFFGGWDLDEGACEDADMLSNAYETGVPMGSKPAGETRRRGAVLYCSSLCGSGFPHPTSASSDCEGDGKRDESGEYLCL